MSEVDHLLQVGGDPPPDLPDVGVVVFLLLGQQHLRDRRGELPGRLGRARQLHRAQVHEDEGAWRKTTRIISTLNKNASENK